MKAEGIKIDLELLKEFKRKNSEERLRFVEYWANYVREHSDEEWSEQQNILIDGQFV